MKNLKIYKGILIITVSAFILTTGCGKVESVKVEEKNATNSNNEVKSIVSETVDIEDTAEKTVMTVEDINNVKIEVVYPDEDDSVVANVAEMNDEIITNYFEEEKTTLKNTKDLSEFKDKSIKLFITMCDFIFYDSEIYGIHYNELKDETKKTILNDFTEIDSIISTKYPNYKEDVQNRYNKAKDWTVDKYNKTINYIKSGLSDETLNNINELKSDLKDTAGSVKDTTSSVYKDQKEKVKTWYEKFKSKH